MRRFQPSMPPPCPGSWSLRHILTPLGALATIACAADPGRCLPGADPGPAPPAPAGTPPNVLVVVLDDVGTDQVRAYGEHPAAPPTPVLDALAARGVRFRNGYAHPSCSPTRAALLTGRHAIRTGAGANYPVDGVRALAPAEVTLAEVLRGAGYTTAAVGKWHLAGVRSPEGLLHPLVQGFDTHRGTAGNLGDAVAGGTGLGYSRWERVVDGQVAVSRCYATTAAVDDVLDVVARAPEPWFVWLGLHAAHAPWHAPPRALVPDPVRDDDPVPTRYAAAVTAADRELGRLLDGLGPERLARTLVVAVGDNGPPAAAAVWPREPHQVKLSLYEGGIGVPWIVAGPGVAPGVSDALIQAEDLLPTVAAHVGADLPAGVTLDGFDLGEVLAWPEAAGPRRVVLAEDFPRWGPPPYDDVRRALRDDSHKIVVRRSAAGETVELYDLRGRFDDGPDLLAGPEPLDAAAAASLASLLAAEARYDAIPYEGP